MLRNREIAKRGDYSALWFRPVPGRKEREAGGGRAVLMPRLLMAVLALGVVSLFAGLIWMVYARGETTAAPVLVSAPEGPVKVKPKDRGGMDVPYRDKLVFSRLTGEPLPATERLRPSIEAVAERPDVPRLEPVAIAAADIVGDGVSGAGAQRSDSDMPASAPSKLPRDQWAVQVAAFNQRRYAIAWLFQAQEKYPEVFGGLEDEINEGINNRIRYYRVRFGPFADREAANAKCDDVRAAGLNCIIVVPETEQK